MLLQLASSSAGVMCGASMNGMRTRTGCVFVLPSGEYSRTTTQYAIRHPLLRTTSVNRNGAENAKLGTNFCSHSKESTYTKVCKKR